MWGYKYCNLLICFKLMPVLLGASSSPLLQWYYLKLKGCRALGSGGVTAVINLQLTNCSATLLSVSRGWLWSEICSSPTAVWLQSDCSHSRQKQNSKNLRFYKCCLLYKCCYCTKVMLNGQFCDSFFITKFLLHQLRTFTFHSHPIDNRENNIICWLFGTNNHCSEVCCWKGQKGNNREAGQSICNFQC